MQFYKVQCLGIEDTDHRSVFTCCFSTLTKAKEYFRKITDKFKERIDKKYDSRYNELISETPTRFAFNIERNGLEDVWYAEIRVDAMDSMVDVSLNEDEMQFILDREVKESTASCWPGMEGGASDGCNETEI